MNELIFSFFLFIFWHDL